MSILEREVHGPCPDPLEIAQEQCPFLASTVLLGDTEQETGVHRDPALAAVGEL